MSQITAAGEEAEVTGGLEHPGVVPLYGLGSYADGRPFYAMRFIKGDSLKEAIARYHSAEGRGAAISIRSAGSTGGCGPLSLEVKTSTVWKSSPS